MATSFPYNFWLATLPTLASLGVKRCSPCSGQEEGRKAESPSLLGISNPSRRSGGKAPGPGKGRSNRGRTVLTEKQRTILSACFQHNPKPDALLKVGAQARHQNLVCCCPLHWLWTQSLDLSMFKTFIFHSLVIYAAFMCLHVTRNIKSLQTMEATGRFGKQRWLKIVWVRLPDKQINAKTFKVISIAAATKKAKNSKTPQWRVHQSGAAAN